MAATIIDGRVVATRIRAEIAEQVKTLVAEHQLRPGLAAVLVGDNPASRQYVDMKRRACADVGIESFLFEVPGDVAQADLEKLIHELNARPDVHGILVQLPLPKHLDEARVLDLVTLEKDVDGIHPLNIGLLAQRGRDPLFVAATPAGIMKLLEEVGTKFEGANAVVLGRSNIVGTPIALLLTRRDATVTICHSKTRDLPNVVRQADIVIAAVGRARMVKGDWVKPGAVVIDVGTNRIEDPTTKSGWRTVGDVDFDAVKEVAGAVSMVPNGVGPMTITMLLYNTLRAAQLKVANFVR